jgi:hypothetical protein
MISKSPGQGLRALSTSWRARNKNIWGITSKESNCHSQKGDVQFDYSLRLAMSLGSLCQKCAKLSPGETKMLQSEEICLSYLAF